jgi:hypothetical protein
MCPEERRNIKTKTTKTCQGYHSVDSYGRQAEIKTKSKRERNETVNDNKPTTEIKENRGRSTRLGT